MPDPRRARHQKGILTHTLHQLLHVDVVRYAVARARYAWYVRIRHQLRTLDIVDTVASNTVAHNMDGLKEVVVDRMLYLIRPLSIVDTDFTDDRVLVIGPRSEGELLLLRAYGFKPKNIEAIDLISYSPWVTLGDMHRIPFSDGTFDVVVLGWVVNYSDDKATLASEVQRVLRPKGIVALGVESNPKTDEELVSELGYLPGSSIRLKTTEQLIQLFAAYGPRVLFRADIPPIPPDDVGNAVVLLSL